MKIFILLIFWPVLVYSATTVSRTIRMDIHQILIDMEQRPEAWAEVSSTHIPISDEMSERLSLSHNVYSISKNDKGGILISRPVTIHLAKESTKLVWSMDILFTESEFECYRKTSAFNCLDRYRDVGIKRWRLYCRLESLFLGLRYKVEQSDTTWDEIEEIMQEIENTRRKLSGLIPGTDVSEPRKLNGPAP